MLIKNLSELLNYIKDDNNDYSKIEFSSEFSHEEMISYLIEHKDDYYCELFLAYCYFKGYGVKEDLKESFSIYEYFAKGGNAKAQYNLALCYDEGKGVEANKEEAFKWYKKSAEQGHVKAQYNLGVCYDYGDGIEANIKEAFKWYKKAAEQGFVSAQYNLALCYDYGDGIEANNKEAFKWYKKAAEQGHVKAQYCLAMCYENGEGVEANNKEALKWYKKAAEQGFAPAQYNLALCYDYGDGIEVNKEEALKWYKKSAEQGHAPAQYNLALCYYDGEGVEANKEEAFKWYKKSAEQDDAQAQYNIGYCYYFGDGIEENKEEALEWWMKSAEQDYAIAQYSLAICYEQGDGIEENLEKALYWYKKAYDNGYTECKNDIEELEEKINSNSSNELKIPDIIDTFISWNHNDLDLKNKFRDYLEENGINVWESDTKCSGNLNKSIEEAINRASSYLIILSKSSFDSEYMPTEVSKIFNKIKSNPDLSDEIVKIYVIDSKDENGNITFDVIKYLNSQDKIFNELKPLSMVFSIEDNTFSNTLTYINNILRNQQIINYRNAIKKEFDVFSISLSQVIASSNNQISQYKPSLTYDKGYVNRFLYDNNDKEYNEKDVLKLSKHLLIYGEGGTGKSLLLKNMIRNMSDNNNLFYYLPCSLIKENLSKSNDLIDLIYEISINLFKCDRLEKEDIVYLFDNENINFYIVIDALDEINDEKNKVIDYVHKFMSKYLDKKIYFIYTSRNFSDSDYISKIINKEVLPLELRKMNNKEIIQLYDNIFERQDNNIKDMPSKDYFINSLSSINDDIINNPLLLSNLIFIYFVTKEPVLHIYELLDKSKKIMIDSLEEERNNSFNKDANFKKLGITIDDILLEYAYDISNGINKDCYELFKEYIENYCESNDIKLTNNEIDSYALEMKKYFQRRRILIGNRMAHDIYLSYFAACFIYNNIYDVKQTKTKKKYIAFKEDDVLLDFINECMKKTNGLWPTITVDFIAKLDYEMHCYNSNNDNNSLSYDTFDESLIKLLDESGISKEAYLGLDKVIKKKLLFFYEFISKYMNRNI